MMAITRGVTKLLESVVPYLPSHPKVLELGEAEWYGDMPAPFGSEGKEAARRYYNSIFGPGVSYVAIDLHGSDAALKLNLNSRIELIDGDEAFDVLVNTGTLEHIFDQNQAWDNCHRLTRPGGVQIHALPLTGWFDHGFYTYNPTLLRDLIAENGYELLAMYHELWDGETFALTATWEFLDSWARENRATDSMLHIALRMPATAAPFITPMQGVYSDRVTTQQAHDWHANRGYHAPDQRVPEESQADSGLSGSLRDSVPGTWPGW